MLVGYRIFVEFKGFGEYVMHKAENLPLLITEAERWIVEKLAANPKVNIHIVNDFNCAALGNAIRKNN